jgi:glucose/arabinose dehydrogenase
MRRGVCTLLVTVVLGVVTAAQKPARTPSPPLPPLPQNFFTSELPVRVSAVATGLSHPWSLVFLPDGGILVTEREGRLRSIREGVLDPHAIPGVPQVFKGRLAGLLDVALHPRFSENRLIYLSYSKAGANGLSATALARGRFDGHAVTDLKDIFIAKSWSKSDTNYGGRIAFDRSGFLFLSVGERQEQERAQNGEDDGGKILRLSDDGSIPADNPFVGKAGYQPEIYSLGHRNPQGLALNPASGEIWENEHGPLGGDEVNIIRPGRNYGWPLVTYGNDYDGTKVSELTSRPGLEPPFLYFVPSLAISGMAFYTGDRFPEWKGNLFVGSMVEGRTSGSGHVRRITFNDKGLPIQREAILTELHQRVRDIRQGPDGLVYFLTDEDAGALLRIEPAP